MSDLNSATTFIGLLERCRRIEVPQIQRDYAQGRETEFEVRVGFLSALAHHAGCWIPCSAATLMNLDFIYGSMEGELIEPTFSLDQQQRLTTLLLLHWDLAWRGSAVARPANDYRMASTRVSATKCVQVVPIF